jgi:hypothetical protein
MYSTKNLMSQSSNVTRELPPSVNMSVHFSPPPVFFLLLL